MTTIHATAGERIIEILQTTGPCILDEVVTYLPNFSRGEVFVAVDPMSRDGRVSLRQVGYLTYQIALKRVARGRLISGIETRKPVPTFVTVVTDEPGTRGRSG